MRRTHPPHGHIRRFRGVVSRASSPTACAFGLELLVGERPAVAQVGQLLQLIDRVVLDAACRTRLTGGTRLARLPGLARTLTAGRRERRPIYPQRRKLLALRVAELREVAAREVAGQRWLWTSSLRSTAVASTPSAWTTSCMRQFCITPRPRWPVQETIWTVP